MKRNMIAIGFLSLATTVWAGPTDGPIDSILEDYLRIQSALASDTTKGVHEAARSMQDKAASITVADSEVGGLVHAIVRAASKIKETTGLEAARVEFFELSKPLLVYLNKHHSAKADYYRYFCPMAEKAWIQSEEEIKNPYHGSSMLGCGTLIE